LLLMMSLVMRRNVSGNVAESKTTCIPAWGRCPNTSKITANFWKFSLYQIGGGPTFHDLLREPRWQHLVGLVETKDLDVVRYERLPLDQGQQPAGRAHNNVNALLHLSDVLGNFCPPNAAMTFDIHVLSNIEDHLLCLLCQFTSRCENKGLSRLNRYVQL
jgi:hypothetical protein